MTSLRVVRSGRLHPALNMALDEALLAGAGPPTLRLYGWSPPGLSLGYFQSSTPFRELEGEHVLVRRPTGGGAIYHDDEITFALTLDAELLPGNVAESYVLLHGAVARALTSVGVPVRLAAAHGTTCGRADGWCFAAPVFADVLTVAGRKIVGSAQRRLRRPRPRVLHHGSLVLRRPALTAFCGSVADYRDPLAVASVLADRLIEETAHCLGLRPHPGSLEPADTTRAERLLQRRHAQPGCGRAR